MSRFTYQTTIGKVGKALLDLSSLADVRAILIEDSLYTPDELTDGFLDDIPVGARIDIVALTNYDFGTTSPTKAFADAVTFTAPTIGKIIKAVVIYRHTGVEATSELLSYDDEQNGLPLETDGNDVFISWDNYIFKLG